MEYKYTECDAEQGRWRVYVPKSGSNCKVDAPKPPIKGPRCGKWWTKDYKTRVKFFAGLL